MQTVGFATVAAATGTGGVGAGTRLAIMADARPYLFVATGACLCLGPFQPCGPMRAPPRGLHSCSTGPTPDLM